MSDVLSNQVNDIQRTSDLLEKQLLRVFKLDAEAQPSADVVGLRNEDFSEKMVFAVLAALLCSGSAATLYDEPVGLIGVGVDAALATGEMLKTAFRSSDNVQRASEKFGSYSGLAPFILLFGLANKVPKQHFADSVAGLTVGTVLLIAATMTLPRTTSEMLSTSVVSVLNRIRKPADAQTAAPLAGPESV